MTTTGTTVKAALPFANSISDTDCLIAINVAVSQSWSRKKRTVYEADVATLASGTYEYALSLTTAADPKIGIAYVYIDEAPALSGATLHRRVRQRRDDVAGTWTLIFPADIVTAYNGKGVDVEYQVPHPALTALSDDTEMPLHYLMHYVAAWYAEQQVSKTPSDSIRYWQNLMVMHNDAWPDALRPHDKALTPLRIVRDRM